MGFAAFRCPHVQVNLHLDPFGTVQLLCYDGVRFPNAIPPRESKYLAIEDLSPKSHNMYGL